MFLCLNIAAPKWTSSLQGNAFTKKDLQVESTSNESIGAIGGGLQWVVRLGRENVRGRSQRRENPCCCRTGDIFLSIKATAVMECCRNSDTGR